MIAQCDKLVAAGITPWVYGDRDGYTTSNMMTTEITSFFDPGDIQRFSPVRSSTPTRSSSTPSTRSTTADASLRLALLLDSPATRCRNDLLNGKVAYMEGQLEFLPTFAPLGDKIGVSLIPYAGTGPLASTNATNAADNWVIPKDAVHPDLAWEFIKLATDATAEAEETTLVGSPPANKAAAAAITDSMITTSPSRPRTRGRLSSTRSCPTPPPWSVSGAATGVRGQDLDPGRDGSRPAGAGPDWSVTARCLRPRQSPAHPPRRGRGAATRFAPRRNGDICTRSFPARSRPS